MHPETIKAELRIRGVTMAALADGLGVSKSMVSHVVYGRFKSRHVQDAIAKLLGRDIDVIWPPKPKPAMRRTSAEIKAQLAAAGAGA